MKVPRPERNDKVGSGRGLFPLPTKICTFFYKMVYFDAFWSTFYTNCNCHYDVHDINSNILKLHMLNSAAKKVDPEIFVRIFLGV